MKPMNDNIPFEADEKPLDEQLRRTLAVQPSTDLADRIFAATVHALRDQRSGVIGHLGRNDRTRWVGWRYAAAIGLVAFYAALWARPHLLPTRISDTELAHVDQLIVDPQTHLDTRIHNVAQQLNAISNGVATPLNPNTNLTSGNTLAQDLYQWETRSF